MGFLTSNHDLIDLHICRWQYLATVQSRLLRTDLLSLHSTSNLMRTFTSCFRVHAITQSHVMMSVLQPLYYVRELPQFSVDRVKYRCCARPGRYLWLPLFSNKYLLLTCTCLLFHSKFLFCCSMKASTNRVKHSQSYTNKPQQRPSRNL